MNGGGAFLSWALCVSFRAVNTLNEGTWCEWFIVHLYLRCIFPGGLNLENCVTIIGDLFGIPCILESYKHCDACYLK